MSTQKQLHSRDARSVPESAPSVNDRLGPTQPRPAWLANIEAALLAARRAIRRAIQDQICDTRRVEFLTQSGPTSSSNGSARGQKSGLDIRQPGGSRLGRP